MDSGETAWLLASNAFDHRQTVTALAAAMPDLESLRDNEDLSEKLAVSLARLGYALISLEPDPDLSLQVDDHLQQKAATEWFGREGD